MSAFQNHLLARLPDVLRASLKRDLERVDLPQDKVLISPGNPILDIFFLETGLSSETAVVTGKQTMQVGMIGREGLVGLPILFGRDSSRSMTMMQIGGSGHRNSAGLLRQATDASADLRMLFLGYAHDFFLQLTGTSLYLNLPSKDHTTPPVEPFKIVRASCRYFFWGAFFDVCPVACFVPL